MTNRIEQTFARVRTEQRAALVTFITAGDPDHDTAAAILQALPDAGADIIELGMPFTDPMADGPVIQAAGLRALAAGADMHKTLALVQTFRTHNTTTPIVLMGYMNPILHYGPEKFVTDAKAAGVDGLILVDLPPEEEGEIKPACVAHDLHFIRLLTPTSGATRLPILTRHASGFLYYVSVTGITGAASADPKAVENQVKAIRQFSDLPICVGFGIKTPEDVAALAPYVDGVVVGSSIVKIVEAHVGQPAAVLVPQVVSFVRALHAGLKK